MTTIRNQLVPDNAYGTIASGLAVGDTALTFTTGHGARFPAVISGQALYCVILNSGNVLEEIKITAHSAGSDSATMVRGVGSTTAKAWSAGDRIEARLSSTVLDNVIPDIVSPMNYGATGDGSADDTSSVSALLAATDMYLPTGKIFKVTSTVTVSSKRRIWGPGKLRCGAAGISVLKLSADGSSVEGISIDNPGNFEDSGTNCIGVEINASNCVVNSCHIDNMQEGVLSNASKTDNVISNNAITNARGTGSESRGDGIYCGGPRSTVTGNTVTCNASTDGRVGIVLEELSSITGYSTCTGNTISGPFRRAIHVEGSPYSTVSGNTCRGSTQWGIIVASTDGVTVANNSVDTPATTTGPVAGQNCVGIYLYVSTNSKVTGNTIIGFGARLGVYVVGTGIDSNNIVEANNILGSAGAITLYGVLVSGANACAVRNNIIANSLCVLNGINAFDAERTIILGNQIAGCGGNGIIVQSTSHNSIVSGNIVRNSVGPGIQVNDSTDVIVEVNRCFDDGSATQTYGVGVFNADRSSVGANNLHGNTTGGISTTGTSSGSVTFNNIT